MSLKILCNHAGASASSFSLVSGTTSSGNLTDLINGQRGTMWRSVAASSAVSPGYLFDSDLHCTHLVAARADKMVTKAGAQIRAMQRNSGGTWSAISGTTIASLAAGNLTGYSSQDLVISLASAADFRGLALEFDSAGTEAMMFSKLCGAVAFDFGVDIDLTGVTFSDIPESGRMFTPPRGSWEYETEKQIVMTVSAVSMAIAEQFKALPQLLHWPFFLYDENADLIPWKLEHVLMEGWSEQIREAGIHDFKLSMRRLKHYT